MQRLIMEFDIGDGYTYSSQVTYPIVYSSKEQAIHDFELLLIEKIDTLYNLNADIYEFEEQRNSLLKTLMKIGTDKRLSDKDIYKRKLAIAEQSKLLETDKIEPLRKKIIDTETILFGGQSFKLGQFVYTRESDNQTDYYLPTIHSLNDYFHSVEHIVDNTINEKPIDQKLGLLDNHSHTSKKNKL